MTLTNDSILGFDLDFAAYKERFESDPYNRMLGIELESCSAGHSKIVLHKTADTPQGIGGSVHGGVLASMVDIAMIAAIFADRRPGQLPAGTADLGISYLRQTHGDRITAEAHVVKRGRQLANVEVDIRDADQRLCARGRVLYAFRASEPDPPSGG